MRPTRIGVIAMLVSGLSSLLAGTSIAAGIADTKHNLSASGPGPVKSTVEPEICLFCHAPHNARRDIPYQWNRADSTVNYTTYESSTLYATVGQPTGASKLCLSCHDGTIALGAVLSRRTEIPFASGLRFIPPGLSRVGTDISDDHPVSFVYDTGLAAANDELEMPSALNGRIKLDGAGQVQCTACHDPHDDSNGKFLVESNRFSTLCVTCHKKRDWDTSAHAQSGTAWHGSPTDPGPPPLFDTVAENGCGNCHTPHTAGKPAGLLKHLAEEDNCLKCHNGQVARSDVAREIGKMSAHRVQNFTGIHEAGEDFAKSVTPHVECSDCHNPHRVTDISATAPQIPGASRGVTGISISGAPVKEVEYLYEVCFKCHADNNVVSFTDVSRQFPQLNTRLEFDISNPSYHPVAFAGKNPDVPSLIPPLNVGSIIYCDGCHNADDSPGVGGAGPKGPHGSVHHPLLERNYSTADFTAESSAAYALCYKCHDRNSILGDESFREHDKHIRGEDAPCSACHDPHGISSTQGTATNNTHLINFDINIVRPNSAGELRFEDRGRFAGACYLTCHGGDHNPETYP